MRRVLNVAEKNDAAKGISAILSRGTSARREGCSKYNKIFDFTANIPQLNGQCHMVMTSVSGHLMDFDFEPKYKNWEFPPASELFRAPIKETVNGNSGNAIKRTLEREVRNCSALIIWTDGDREGENIGFEIIRICKAVHFNLTVLRARFSEITSRAMEAAIRNLVEPDEDVSKAVDVRRELDLRFGAAFTRLQTLTLRRHLPESKDIFSYGPCQFPTMGFVIHRYLEILEFKSQPFWLIDVKHSKKNIQASFNWQRVRLFNEHACLAFFCKMMECSKARVVKVKGNQKKNWRPEPMYTTSMEKLASSKLRMPAKKCMEIAEKLYTRGIISYPRTETNIFPKGMDLNNLVRQQLPHPLWGQFAQKFILDKGGANPRAGKKTDNAHPPIHPTRYAAPTELVGDERALYELITRHFLACVSSDAVGFETEVTIDINGEEFKTTGLIIHELNYLEVYVYFKWNAKEIPPYLQGEEFVPDSIMMCDGKTTPPQLLTESELISLMEKHGIGTDATHAEHIDKIQKRQYVKKLKTARFIPSKLGLTLYEGYHSMRFSHLIRPELRCRLEQDLQKVCEAQRNHRDVASEYIEEHIMIYSTVERDKMKIVEAFVRNKSLPEPEIRMRTALSVQ